MPYLPSTRWGGALGTPAPSWDPLITHPNIDQKRRLARLLSAAQ